YRTPTSPDHRATTSSNSKEEELKKDSSPLSPSGTGTWEMPTAQEEESDVDKLKPEGTCSRVDPDPSKGPSAGRAASFARLLSEYPHPRGQREKPAYEPLARRAWAKLNDAQRAGAIDGAPHAPGKIWLAHWINDARETGIFEIVKQPVA